MDGNGVEDILSEELRELLGPDCLVEKKAKRSHGDVTSAPEECLQAARKMSKNEQKKFQHIELRKEKEAKRATYLQSIQRNAISEEHQDLLLSTREIGHTMTYKEALKRVFRRYKAGLTLSEEEKELLFPTGAAGISPKEAAENEHGNSMEEGKTETVELNSSAADDVVVDVGDLFGAAKLPIRQDVVASKVERPSTSPPASATSSSQSVGASILSQLSSLKSAKGTKVGGVSIESAASIPETKPYVPEPILLPQMTGGQQRDETITAESSVVKSSAKNSNVELRRPVIVNRDPKIQVARMALPICGMEQEVVEAVNENDVVILCGETGSGKSTQVPQFLYEAGYGKLGVIAVTEPRRVAATSTARRVAEELSCGELELKKECKKKTRLKPIRKSRGPRSLYKSHGTLSSTNESVDEWPNRLVAYHVRFDATTLSARSRVVFMTDGILLREITSDLLLRKYSVVIIDEAHERNINTDVLLGMLSRSVPMRRKLAEEEMARWQGISEAERLQYDEPIAPLKLVIMSATLRVDEFRNPRMFCSPPVISVEARQFPVDVHFSRRTEMNNYLTESFRKVCDIHRKLPDGGILVFLTGKREIMHMCRKLERTLNKAIEGSTTSDEFVFSSSPSGIAASDEFSKGIDDWEELEENGEASDSDEIIDFEANSSLESDVAIVLKPEEAKEVGVAVSVREQMLREVVGSSTADSSVGSLKDEADSAPSFVHVLPLFAMLSQQQQAKVFLPPPSGRRLIVVATNVAETSITIPGIRYVVDCGREKELRRDHRSGISKFEVSWISKASADQRKGRAGRTGPGHCYRLYSSAFYDQHMQSFKDPAILSAPLEDLLLQMKSMGIPSVDDFPFPTQPHPAALRSAQDLLVTLGAIELDRSRTNSSLSLLHRIEKCKQKIEAGMAADTQSAQCFQEILQLNSRIGNISALGRRMSRLPINPRFSKIILTALDEVTGVPPKQVDRAVVFAVTLVSVLAEKSPFLFSSDSRDMDENIDESDEDLETNEKPTSKGRSALWWHPLGDALARLRAIGACSHLLAKSSTDISSIQALCRSQNLHQQIVDRCISLRNQILGIVNESTGAVSETLTEVTPPSQDEETQLCKLLVAGYSDCVARRAPPGLVKEGSRRSRLTAYLSCNPTVTEPLYIHPQSSLYERDPTASLPEFVVYSSLMTNSRGTCTYMDCVTPINPSWIPAVAGCSPLLLWSNPLSSPPPSYDAQEDCVVCYSIPRYGVHRWELSPVKRSLHEIAMETAGEEAAPLGFRKRDEGFRWFGRLLLEGKVIKSSELSSLFSAASFKVKPSSLTDMKPVPVVLNFARELVKHNVCSKASLLAKLQDSSDFLCEELEQFLLPNLRKSFRSSWKRLNNA